MADDYQLTDALDCEGDWPGGLRYGVDRHSRPRDRPWSSAERTLAAWLGRRLPEVDEWWTETWMDQPQHETCEMVFDSEPVAVCWSDEPISPLSEMSYRRKITYAKKYGRNWWATPDPLADVRPPDPEPPVRVLSMVGDPLRQIEPDHG